MSKKAKTQLATKIKKILGEEIGDQFFIEHPASAGPAISYVTARLVKLVEAEKRKDILNAYKNGRTSMVLDLLWGQTTLKEEEAKLEFPMEIESKGKSEYASGSPRVGTTLKKEFSALLESEKK